MGGPRVLTQPPADRRPLDGPGAIFQVLLDPSSGSERLLQRLLCIAPGATGGLGPHGADDALYIVRGTGLLRSKARNESYRLRPGTAALAPAGVETSVMNPTADDLEILSVLSPPPFGDPIPAIARDLPLSVIHEDDQDLLPAGEDRGFKLLVESPNLTQFVGFIRKSRAPLHEHTYEEAIHILEGDGVVHIGDDLQVPIRPGATIFLPPGTRHCLENRSEGTLKLLGVFSPPGSPAARREADD
jgi:mannose-6-phosphate isomerase-like protein (cupin superfamily)